MKKTLAKKIQEQNVSIYTIAAKKFNTNYQYVHMIARGKRLGSRSKGKMIKEYLEQQLKTQIKEDNATKLEINSIRSLYPKDNVIGIIDWMNSKDNLLLYVNKEKALNFIFTQSTHLIASKNKTEDFNSTANVIKNFENLKLNTEIPSKIGDKELSKDNIKDIFNGKTIEINNVTNKNGQKKNIKNGKFHIIENTLKIQKINKTVQVCLAKLTTKLTTL